MSITVTDPATSFDELQHQALDVRRPDAAADPCPVDRAVCPQIFRWR